MRPNYALQRAPLEGAAERRVGQTKGAWSLFEFHGWAVLRVGETIATSRAQIDVVRSELVMAVNVRLEELRDPFSRFQISESGNDMNVLTAHGAVGDPQALGAASPTAGGSSDG